MYRVLGMHKSLIVSPTFVNVAKVPFTDQRGGVAPPFEDFGNRGVVFVDELSEIPPGSNVLYSAHGVSPEIRKAAEQRHADHGLHQLPDHRGAVAVAGPAGELFPGVPGGALSL